MHEIKGASTASAGTTPVSNGAGSHTWELPVNSVGWWDYHDVTTVSTPIALTTPGTAYDLTNDGAGTNTQTGYALDGVGAVWDVATNRFDFTDLKLGYTVELRMDMDITTTNVNSAITVYNEFGIGGASGFTLVPMHLFNYKAVGSYHQVISVPFYIGNADMRDLPARIQAESDTAGVTITVHGWYIKVTTA